MNILGKAVGPDTNNQGIVDTSVPKRDNNVSLYNIVHLVTKADIDISELLIHISAITRILTRISGLRKWSHKPHMISFFIGYEKVK